MVYIKGPLSTPSSGRASASKRRLRKRLGKKSQGHGAQSQRERQDAESKASVSGTAPRNESGKSLSRFLGSHKEARCGDQDVEETKAVESLGWGSMVPPVQLSF